MLSVHDADPHRRSGHESNGNTNAFLESFVVIDNVDVAQQLDKLETIRSDRHRFLTPVFLRGPETDETRCLSDGSVTQVSEASERAARIERRVESLPRSYPELDDTDRLLQFLYTREDFAIRPIRDCKNARSYRYPLLDALREFETDSRLWLAALEKSELLEACAGLVDRMRHCPSCDSTHLNYIDLCPACASLEITHADFLHCFGCGYVAPKRAFETVGGRACPKCSRVLRHIGIDYDRALQSFTCSACSSSFSDAKIAARCLNCNRDFDPAHLRVREVRVWKLARAGRLAACERATTPQTVGSLASIASEKQFGDLVAWAERTRQRHAQARFGLIYVRLDSGELRSRIECDAGFSQALWQRVRAAVRDSDVVGEGPETSLWIFCPHADPSTLDSVGRRIASLGDAIDDTFAGRATLRVECLHSNEIPIADRPGELLAQASRLLHAKSVCA